MRSVYVFIVLFFVHNTNEEWVCFNFLPLIESELHRRLMPSYQTYKLSVIKRRMTNKQFWLRLIQYALLSFYFTIDSTACFYNRMYKVWYHLLPFMDWGYFAFWERVLFFISQDLDGQTWVLQFHCFVKHGDRCHVVHDFMLLVKGGRWGHSG